MLESKHIAVVDGVLYREDRDRQYVVVPWSPRVQLIKEVALQDTLLTKRFMTDSDDLCGGVV